MRFTRFATIFAIFVSTVTALIPRQPAARHAIAVSESISKKWNILPGSRIQTMTVQIDSDLLPGNTLTLQFIWNLANRVFTITDWALEIPLTQLDGGFMEGFGVGQAPVPNAQNIDIGINNFNILLEYEQPSGRLLTVELGENDDAGIDVINTLTNEEYSYVPTLGIVGSGLP